MERFVKSATTGPSTHSALQNEYFTKPLLKDNNNVEVKQQRFTSSVTINKFKILDRYVSIIVKSESDAAEIPQSLYNTNLVQDATNIGQGDVKIIVESSSKNYEPSTLNKPAPSVNFDSSDTLHFNMETIRLRAEEKRLEVERMDAEFRKTDREGWLKKQEMEIRKLELEKDIKGLDLKKLELMEPKELKQCKFKVYGNLVKQVAEGSEISNSVNSSSENYAFSGEIVMNQEPDIADPLTATVTLISDTAEVQKFQLCKPQSAQEEDTKGDTKDDITEDTKPREEEVSLDNILKHRVILDNLELTYGLTGHLIEDEVLNTEAQEDIQREGTTRYEQCDRLLNYINDANLNSFLDGLRRTMQSHLAEYIGCSISMTERETDRSGDWPLDEEERKTINKLYVLLVKDMATNELLDDLISEDCISELHRECINGCGVKFMRNRELLDIMRRRSQKQLKKFWELVIKYSQHLKNIIEKFLVPGNTLTLVKVNIKDNLTEEQKQKIKNNSVQPRRTFSNRDGDASTATDEKQVNFCISGEEIFAIVPVEEQEVESSSMIVSEETKSLVSEALVSCTGEDKVIVETLENVEYKENKSMNDIERNIFSLSTSTTILQQDARITGIAIVDDKMFLVKVLQAQVNVYNWRTLAALSDITIPTMKGPVAMAGCSHNKVLYICDQELNCIHRVNITDNSVKRWSVRTRYEIHNLSVTSENNVLLTVIMRDTNGKCGIIEYNSDGQVMRKRTFERSIKYANLALELSTDQFIICHGIWGSMLNRVCVVNYEGQIMKYFGGEKRQGEDQVDRPHSLTIDRKRQIVFVPDFRNHRVVMLDYNMTYLGLVRSLEYFEGPTRVYFDQNTDRLIVAAWLPSPRILVISPDRKIK